MKPEAERSKGEEGGIFEVVETRGGTVASAAREWEVGDGVTGILEVTMKRLPQGGQK